MALDQETFVPPGANIKVIGIGGGGGNAVNTMIRTNIEGVDFIAANTDVQALRFSLASRKIQIGKELTRGLGAGADPDIGRDAMLEDRHAITEALAGAHMVFITAGMGGGTGTGGAAIVANIAREMGALTVAVVTKPFAFEGKRRMKYAEEGIRRLEDCVDTLITIPNQRLLEIASPDLSMIDAFRMADNVLVNAVKGISDIINIPGQINVDFADVKAVMSSMGLALMGIGLAEGPNRAQEAAQRAIRSPLLEDVSIEGATGILINITAGESLSILEVNVACSIIQEAAHEDANIIFGTVIDENIGQQMRVTVIATGFSQRDADIGRDQIAARAKRGLYMPKAPAMTMPSYPRAESRPEPKASPVLPPQPAQLQQEAKPRMEESLARLTLENVEKRKDNAAMTPNATESLFGSSERELKIEGASAGPARLNLDALDGLEAGEFLDATDKNDFAQPASSDELDRKIDEALKIAEQLSKSPSPAGEDEDLDIPSFLRKSNKDLSLT